MLRRTQPIASRAAPEPSRPKQTPSKAEETASPGIGVERRKSLHVSQDPADQEAKQSGPYGVDRRMSPRLKFDKPDPEDKQVAASGAGQTDPARVERRKLERRNMDAVRAELQRATVPKVEKPGVHEAIRRRLPQFLAIKPSRILLLVVALLTGGLAAFMANKLNQQTAGPAMELAAPIAKAQITQEARVRILVARQTIGIGQRLSPASVAWQDWPKGSVRPDYITLAAAPGAISNMKSDVARFEFFPGDPIRKQKLVQTDQGYLSAVLGRGQRGVSVLVSAASASGGFIVPNDHVDVVLTPSSSTGAVSQTILENVRVLAINTRLGEKGTTGAPADPANPRAEIFTNEAIATLELDPARAEVLVSAATLGKLSLVLRSMADFAKSDNIARSGTNQAIRLTSPFWAKPASQTPMQ